MKHSLYGVEVSYGRLCVVHTHVQVTCTDLEAVTMSYSGDFTLEHEHETEDCKFSNDSAKTH